MFAVDDRAAVVPKDWRPQPLPNLTGAKVVFADFETTGLRWYKKDRPCGLAYSVPGGPRGYVPFAHAGGNLDEAQVKAWARSPEGLAGKHVIGAGVKFDAHEWRVWQGFPIDEIGVTLGDVQHNAALLDDGRRRFNLDQLAKDELGPQEGKLKLDLSRGAHIYHACEVEAYAIQDVELTRRVHEVQLPRLAAQDLLDVMRLEEACLFPTLEMEWNGSLINLEKLDRWVIETEQEYYRLLWQLADVAGFQVNPNSAGDMARLFRSLNLEPVLVYDPKTKERKVGYGDEALATYDHVPQIALARAVRKLDSLRSKYLVKYQSTLRNTDGILRYALHQLRADEGGAISGRYASAGFKVNDGEKEGVNSQQVLAVEKQIEKFGDRYIVRELFEAETGRRYWAADAEQVEYRVFAHFSEDADLIKAYADDPRVNFHRHVEKMLIEMGANLPYKAVKNTNFCKLFGGGVEKIAYMTGTPLDKADEFVRNYDRGFPAASRMLRKAAKLAANRGWVRTLSGRRARFPTGERLHSALNRVIQGSAADINKTKLIALYRERRRLNLTMRLTVHDEVCGDVPDQTSADACNALLNEQDFPLRVPILWKGGLGANWAECA